MLAVMKRPALPKVLQRDIRNGRALRPTRSNDRSGRATGLLHVSDRESGEVRKRVLEQLDKEAGAA